MKTLLLALLPMSAFAGTYAQVENGVVINVIVADEDFISKQPGEYISSSNAAKGDQVIYTPEGPSFSKPVIYSDPMPTDGVYDWDFDNQVWVKR